LYYIVPQTTNDPHLMKKLMTTLLVLTVFAVSSYAQAEDDYAKALKRMFEVSGSEEAYKVAIIQMMSIFKQQSSGVDDALWTELEQEFLKSSLYDLTEMLIPVYQKYMTLEDLQAMIAFYQSPVGEKYAKSTPFIMQESMQVGQAWGAQLGQKVADRLKEKGY